MLMKQKELEQLIKKHTIAQEEANSLYSKIINEIDNRGLADRLDVLSCLNNTEQLIWEELVLKLVKGED